MVNWKFWRKKYKLELASQKWLQQLGQHCLTCKVRINQAESISVCGCYLFCHQDCFVERISPFLCETSEVKCTRCDQQIKFVMNKTITWVCNKKPTFIISAILSVVFLTIMIILTTQGLYRMFWPDSVSYTFEAIGGFVLAFTIIKSSRRKIIKLKDVHVIDTKLTEKLSQSTKVTDKKSSSAQNLTMNKLQQMTKVMQSRGEIHDYQVM